MKKPGEAVESATDWAHQPERSNLALMRAVARVSLLLGRRATRVVVYVAAAYFLVCAPRARKSSRAYLERALGRACGWREVYRHLLAFGTVIHDRLFLLSDRFELFDIELVGDEALYAANADRQGVVLLGAHFGSFEVLRTMGWQRVPARVSMLMYEENARKIGAMLAAINPAAAADIVALGRADSMLRVRETLEAGHYIGILADRDIGAGGRFTQEFLGQSASFPLGPLRMAALMRRPVFFMAGIYLGANRYRVEFVPLADFSQRSEEGRDARVRAAGEQYVYRLEAYCRAAPYNWFNYFDFWRAP